MSGTTTTEVRWTPSDFGPGKSGPQMQWLNTRLTLHGHPMRFWGQTLRDRVAEFQRRWWSGVGADGLIGPKTLEKLYASPVVEPGPPSSKIPADILNLKYWKETLPVDLDGNGSPDEIKQPKLSIYSHPKFFHVNDTLDGVVFRADCDGFHTENSFFPRSELREMADPEGKAGAAWDSGDGKTHTMEILQAITHRPEIKPEVVAGQIHDEDDDVCKIRLDGSKLYVESDHASDQVLTSNYILGAKFRIRIVANSTGIDVWYNGVKKAHIDGTFEDCYFKAGCYTQATSKVASTHEKYGTGYGEVVIYELEVTHE